MSVCHHTRWITADMAWAHGQMIVMVLTLVGKQLNSNIWLILAFGVLKEFLEGTHHPNVQYCI